MPALSDAEGSLVRRACPPWWGGGTGHVPPRSLCYSIQARLNEVASIQSRVEDILFATPAEKALWAWTTRCEAGGSPHDVAISPELVKALPGLTEEVAGLRKDEVALDRRLAAMVHERKMSEATALRMREYVPMVSRLEYAQREAALLEWAMSAQPGGLLASDGQVSSLSLTARSALARVVAALGPDVRKTIKPVLADMLSRPYLASYADLCLYQSAMMSTEKPLALRISRWLGLNRSPDPRGLMEIMHPMPGVMSTAERSDNAYQPQILEWADKCRGKDAMARFTQAHALTNEFYRKAGYNNDKPVYTMRDILENQLVDCIAASRICGAVAASAGVSGIVPVRYWRDKAGHSIIGIRTDKGILIMDPLAGPETRPFPGGYPNVMTVETGAPTFGTYVTDAVEIVGKAKVLRMEIPYLQTEKAK